MSEVKLNITTENNEVIIRTGEAEPNIPERQSISISGNLDTPLNYLKNPPSWFTRQDEDSNSVLEFSNLKVDRDSMIIELVVDEGSIWQCSYKGALLLDETFKKFGINASKSFTTFELSDLIKMHRSYFETKDIAMKLISELRNFKAKVDRQIDNADDTRGNKRVLCQQAVDSNIPEEFKIILPIFKGYEKQSISLEVVIDASDFSCRLISPEASDYINELKNGLIDEQVKLIEGLFPVLKKFEV